MATKKKKQTGVSTSSSDLSSSKTISVSVPVKSKQSTNNTSKSSTNTQTSTTKKNSVKLPNIRVSTTLVSDGSKKRQTITPDKWYSGDTPTSRETVARMYQVAGNDSNRLSELQQQYEAEISNKGSVIYNPYTKATNTKAIEGLTALGYDVSDVDSFLANNKWLMNYARETTTGYGAHAPTKSSSDLQDAAYWYSELYEAQERTTAAQTEMSQLASDIGYLVERGYSDDAIIAMTKKDFSSNYGTLAKMDDNRLAGEASILNKAVNYNGDDTLYGMIWAARNDDTSGDYFADSVKYTMGIGNKYVYDANSEAARDPSNYEQYNPYAMGSNLTDWNKRTGSTKIDDTTLEAWREQMLSVGASDEDQKLWQSAYEANENTKAAQSELTSLDSFVQEQYSKGKTADEICAMVTAMIDPEDGKVDSDYTTLGKMESKRKMGSYLSMGDTVDFTLPTYLRKIRSMEGTIEQAEVDPSTVASDYENYNPYTSYVVDGWTDAAGGEAMTREYLDAHREWLDDEDLAEVWRKADTALDNGDKANAELEELDSWMANKVKRGWSAEKIVDALDEELSNYSTLSNMEEYRERGEAYAVAGADFTKPAYIRKIYEATGETMPETVEFTEEQTAATEEQVEADTDTDTGASASVDWFFKNAKKDKTIDEYMEDTFGVSIASFTPDEQKEWAQVRNAVQAAKVTGDGKEAAEEQAAAFAERMSRVAQGSRVEQSGEVEHELTLDPEKKAEIDAAAEAKANAYKESAAYASVYATGEELREGMAQGEATQQAATEGDTATVQQGSQNPTPKSEESAAYLEMCKGGEWNTQAFDWAKQNSTNWNAVRQEMVNNIAEIRRGNLKAEDAGLAGSWWNKFGHLFNTEEETWTTTNSVMGASRRTYNPADNYGETLGGFIKETNELFANGEGDLDVDDYYGIMVDASRIVENVENVAGEDLNAEVAESIVDGSYWGTLAEDSGDPIIAQQMQTTPADKIEQLKTRRDNNIADTQREETAAQQAQYKQNRAALDEYFAAIAAGKDANAFDLIGATQGINAKEVGKTDETYMSLSDTLAQQTSVYALTESGALPEVNVTEIGLQGGDWETASIMQAEVQKNYSATIKSRATAILNDDMTYAAACGMTLDEYYKAYPDRAKTADSIVETAKREFNEAYGQDLPNGVTALAQELEQGSRRKDQKSNNAAAQEKSEDLYVALEAEKQDKKKQAQQESGVVNVAMSNREIESEQAKVNDDKKAAADAGQTLLEYYNANPERKEEVAKLTGMFDEPEVVYAEPKAEDYATPEEYAAAQEAYKKVTEKAASHQYDRFDKFLTENADKIEYYGGNGRYVETKKTYTNPEGRKFESGSLLKAHVNDPLDAAIYAANKSLSAGESVRAGLESTALGFQGSAQKLVYNGITLDPNDKSTQETIRRSYNDDTAAYKADLIETINKYYPEGDEKEAVLKAIDSTENIWSIGMSVGSAKWKGKIQQTEAEQEAVSLMVQTYGTEADQTAYEVTQSTASSLALMATTAGIGSALVPAMGATAGNLTASILAAWTEGADTTYDLREKGVGWDVAAIAGAANQIFSGATEALVDINVYNPSSKALYALHETLEDGLIKTAFKDPKTFVKDLLTIGAINVSNFIGETAQEELQLFGGNIITRLATGEDLIQAEDWDEAKQTAKMTVLNTLLLTAFGGGYVDNPSYINELTDMVNYANSKVNPAFDGDVVNYVIEKNTTQVALDACKERIAALATSPEMTARNDAKKAADTALTDLNAAQEELNLATANEAAASAAVQSASDTMNSAETVTADMTKALTDANKALTDATAKRAAAETKVQTANEAYAQAKTAYDTADAKVAAAFAQILNSEKEKARASVTEQFFADATPEQRAAFEEYLAACAELRQAKTELATAKKIMERMSEIAASDPNSRKGKAAVTTYGRLLTVVDQKEAHVAELNDKVNALYEGEVSNYDTSKILKEGEPTAANEVTDEAINESVNDAVNESETPTEETASEETTETASEEATTEETTEQSEEPTEFDLDEATAVSEEESAAEAEAATASEEATEETVKEAPKTKTKTERAAEEAIAAASADPTNARKQREADIAVKEANAEKAEAELNASMSQITNGLQSRDASKRAAAVQQYRELADKATKARQAVDDAKAQVNYANFSTAAAQTELREAIDELSQYSNKALAFEGHPQHEAAEKAYERVQQALLNNDIADARNSLSEIADILNSEDTDSARKYQEAEKRLQEVLAAKDSWTGEQSTRRAAAVMAALRQGGLEEIENALNNRENRDRDNVAAKIRDILHTSPADVEKLAERIGLNHSTAQLTIKNDTGATGQAGVTRAFAESTTTLSKNQNKQLEILDMLGKDVGVEIVVHPTISTVEGAINGTYIEGNTIHVGLDALGQGYVQAGFHEVTHWIEKNNSKAFEGLKAVVRQALEANGANWDELVKSRIEQYAESGVLIDEEAAEGEIVAESCGLVLTDEQNMKKFAADHKSAFKTVMQRFQQFWRRLRAIATNIAYKNQTGEMDALIGKGSDLQKIYDNFIKAARETGMSLQQTFDGVEEVVDTAATDTQISDLQKQIQQIRDKAAALREELKQDDLTGERRQEIEEEIGHLQGDELDLMDELAAVNAEQEETAEEPEQLYDPFEAGDVSEGVTTQVQTTPTGNTQQTNEAENTPPTRLTEAQNKLKELLAKAKEAREKFETAQQHKQAEKSKEGKKGKRGKKGKAKPATAETASATKAEIEQFLTSKDRNTTLQNINDRTVPYYDSVSFGEAKERKPATGAFVLQDQQGSAKTFLTNGTIMFNLQSADKVAKMDETNAKNMERTVEAFYTAYQESDEEVNDEGHTYKKPVDIRDWAAQHPGQGSTNIGVATLTPAAFKDMVRNGKRAMTITFATENGSFSNYVDAVMLKEALDVLYPGFMDDQSQQSSPITIYSSQGEAPALALSQIWLFNNNGESAAIMPMQLDEINGDVPRFQGVMHLPQAVNGKNPQAIQTATTPAEQLNEHGLTEKGTALLADLEAEAQAAEEVRLLREADEAGQLWAEAMYDDLTRANREKKGKDRIDGDVIEFFLALSGIDDEYDPERLTGYSGRSDKENFGDNLEYERRTGIGLYDGMESYGLTLKEVRALAEQSEKDGSGIELVFTEDEDEATEEEKANIRFYSVEFTKPGALAKFVEYMQQQKQKNDAKETQTAQTETTEQQKMAAEEQRVKAKHDYYSRRQDPLNLNNVKPLELLLNSLNSKPGNKIRGVKKNLARFVWSALLHSQKVAQAKFGWDFDTLSDKADAVENAILHPRKYAETLTSLSIEDKRKMGSLVEAYRNALIEQYSNARYSSGKINPDEKGYWEYEWFVEDNALTLQQLQEKIDAQQGSGDAKYSLNTSVLATQQERDIDTIANYIADQLVNNGDRAVELARALSEISGGMNVVNTARNAARQQSGDGGQRISYMKGMSGDKQAAPGVTGKDRTAANQAEHISPTTGEVLQDTPDGNVTNPVQIMRQLTDSIRVGLNAGGQMAANGTRRMPRGVAGFYDRRARAITSRTTEASDLSVGLHEFGHAVQDRLSTLVNPQGGTGLTANQQMIDALPQGFRDNYTQAELDGEAVAEFVCDYMYSRDLAVQTAGEDFVQNFERMLRSDPTLLSAMNRARDQVTIWANASTGDRVKSMVSQTSTTQKRRHGLRRVLNDLNRAIFDSTAPASLVSDDLRKAAQWSSFSAKRAGMILTDRLIDPEGNTIGDSLATRWANLGVDESMREDIEAYALARHALDRDTQGTPVFDQHEITREELEEYVARVEADNPQIVRAADALTEFWNDFFDAWFVDTGMVSREAVNAMRRMYPHYVPTYRVQDKNMSTGSNVNSTFELRAARGSTLEVVSPIASITNMVQQVVKTISQNEVMRQFHREMQTGGYGWLATQETQDFTMTQVNTGRAERALVDLVENSDDIDMPAVQDLYDAIVSMQEQWRGTGQNFGRNVVSGVDENGQRFFYRINDDYQGLYELLSGTGDAQLTGKFWNTVRKLKNSFTQLTTAKNPFFLPKNIIRDMQASVNTGTWATTYADGIVKWGQAFYDVIRNSEDFQEYINMGGGEYTRFSNDTQTNVNKMMGKLFENGQTVTPKKIVQTALNVLTLSQLNEIAEATSRYAEYKYGRHDRSTFEGRREAFMAAQNVTTNFGAHGASTAAKVANTVIPFCNATLQGLSKDINIIAGAFDSDGNVRKESWTAIGKTILNVGLTAALQAALVGAFGDDDDKDEDYGYGSLSLRTENFLIPTGNAANPYIRIPIEQGPLARTIYGVALNLMSDISGMDELSVDLYAMAQNIIRDTAPDGSLFQGVRDAANNTTYYGRQIVSDYAGKRSAPNQYNSDTLDVFKQMSSALYSIGIEISPAVMQYGAEQYSGVLGKFIIPALSGNKYTGERSLTQSLQNIGQAALKNFTADPVTYSDTMTNYNAAKETATAIRYDYQNGDTVYGVSSLLDEYEIEEAVDEATKMNKKGGIFYDADQEISDLWDEISEIEQATVLTDSEKAEQIRVIRREMNDIMTNALEEWSIYKMYYIDHDELAIEATERIKKGAN